MKMNRIQYLKYLRGQLDVRQIKVLGSRAKRLGKRIEDLEAAPVSEEKK